MNRSSYGLRARRLFIRKIRSQRGGRAIIRMVEDELNIQTFGFFIREIGQYNIITHPQRLDALAMQFFDIGVSKKFFRHDYDLRNTTSPSTSSESIIDMITASTGVSFV